MEKPWEEVSEKERIKQKKEKCRYCIYSAKLASSQNGIDNLYCDYAYRTKQCRMISPLACDKFKRKKRGAKREQSSFNGPINP